MKRLLLIVSLVSSCHVASAEGVVVTSEFVGDPWKAMEEKEREYRAEIERLKAAQRIAVDQKPTPAILVRGDRRLTVDTLDTCPLPDYSAESEPKKKKGLVGPSMGWNGPRFKVKRYPMSAVVTRTPMSQQVSYE